MPVPVEPTVSLQQLVGRVSAHLLDNPNWCILTLADATTPQATVDDGSKVDSGYLINVGRPGVDTGDELVSVMSVAGNQLQVVRGMFGSTPAAATSVFSLVSPRYPTFQIERTIVDVVDSLWPYCWQVVEKVYTLDPSVNYYPLPTDFVDMVSASQLVDPASTPPEFVQYGAVHRSVDDRWWNTSTYPLAVVDLPGAQFPTNRALYVQSKHNTVNPLSVLYRAKVDKTTVLDGLMAQCVEFGAVSLLMGMQQAQIAGETSPLVATAQVTQTNIQGAEWYRRQFEVLRNELRVRYLRLLPPAGVWR